MDIKTGGHSRRRVDGASGGVLSSWTQLELRILSSDGTKRPEMQVEGRRNITGAPLGLWVFTPPRGLGSAHQSRWNLWRTPGGQLSRR